MRATPSSTAKNDTAQIVLAVIFLIVIMALATGWFFYKIGPERRATWRRGNQTFLTSAEKIKAPMSKVQVEKLLGVPPYGTAVTARKINPPALIKGHFMVSYVSINGQAYVNVEYNRSNEVLGSYIGDC